MSPNVRLSHGRPRNGLNRVGLTLVEMLVATALTLILFGAVAEMFSRMGASVNDARSTIELSGNLRTAGNHLRRDLNNLTVKVGPWVYPGTNQGYFQIIEGPDRDIDFATKAVGPYVVGSGEPFPGSLAGDADDIVSFTAYSKEKPFVGLIQGRLVPVTVPAPPAVPGPYKYVLDTSDPTLFTVITSHYAEVVYFTKLTPFDDRNLSENANYQNPGLRDPDETVTLFRRVLLIRPDIDVQAGLNNRTFYEVRNNFDLSVSAGALTQWQTNSLERLQDRRYRVGHMGPGLLGSVPSPYPMNPANLLTFEQLDELNTAAGNPHRNRTGEDVLMRKVLAFDVKVFDPHAIIQEDTLASLSVLPGDREYGNPNGNDVVNPTPTVNMRGAFVDLNWNRDLTTNPHGINAATGQPNGLLAAPHVASGLRDVTVSSLVVLNGGTPIPQLPSMLMRLAVPPHDGNLPYATYDTFPYSYLEGTGAVNGFDDNADGIIDSLGERNLLWTSESRAVYPPYPVPLRGMQITIRAIEDGTRIIRQDTVTTNFMPR